MASEVVSIALETVRDLLIEEAKFLSGVSDQVKEVQAELIEMQSFLKDADRRQVKEETVRNYVREIRRLAYRTENVLDKFAIEVESRRQGRGFRKALQRSARMLCEGRALHQVGSEIGNIKANINSLTTRLQTYGIRKMTFDEGQSPHAILDQNQQQLRQTYPHQVEEYFVGMKDDIRQLVSLITDDEIRSHRVISIYGMGGLGKTTLARKVYNHADVQRGFKEFAWVSVTQQYNTRTIFRDVLTQLLPDHKKKSVKDMEEREMVVELYKVQKETKCLVVLDDVWEVEDWECLKVAFPFAEANSKILITTRNQKLSEAEFPYALKFLNEDEGWELLQTRAFAKRDAKGSENDPKLEAVGRAIVNKCGKLPLAISVLGGVLSQKNSLHEWETVNSSVDSYLRMTEGSKEGYGAVLQVLALSYDELPYHLKPCFLHLGHFREDEDIDAEMLYLMWIAEGMVLSDHRGKEETLTDVAERYLHEMARRSMVQVKLDEFSTSGKVQSCYLHDLMREFCLDRGKEVEFLQFLDFRGGKDPLSDSSTGGINPSRCSIHMEYSRERNNLDDNNSRISMALEANGQLRSLVISASSEGLWGRDILFPKVLCHSNKFKYLRVLKFETFDFKGKGLPKGIKKLIHLRFLSLKGSNLDKLPSSIGQLQYLQTLDIRVGFAVIQVPNVLWKLKRLRHLYFGIAHSGQRGKRKLSYFGLSNLETLVGFDSFNDEFKDVSALNNLRHLEATVYVREKNDVSQILNYLNSNQHKLREVQLRIAYFSNSSSLTEEDKVVPFKDFLACLSVHQLYISWGKCEFQKVEPTLFPSNLNELTLWRCTIEGDPMDFLGKLPNLTRLSLEDFNLGERKTMVCEANAFPKLISLRIVLLSNLENWVVAKGSMPNLSYLEIVFCEKLEMIPDGLRFLTTLKKLKIVMPKQFNVQRIHGVDNRGGVDYDKISHVPLITIEVPPWEKSSTS